MIDEPLTTLAQESEEDALRRVQQLAQERLNRKAELDPRSALRRGFAAGIDNLQSSAYGLTAMAGDAIGSERLAEYGIEGYQRNADQAADDLRGVTVDLRDVDGAGALGEFVAVNLGMMAPDLLAAATGAGVAAVAGKKLTQKAATELIRKRIDDKAAALVAGGIARDRAQELAMQTTAAAVSRAAGMTGSVAAMSGIFAGRQAGSLAEETGDVHTLPSAVSGVLQGSLEMVPFFRLAKRFGGDELAAEATAGIRDRAIAIAKRAALASADGAVTEGITETLQSVIEQATVSYVTDNDHLFSDEHLEELLVAGASGALLGGILGAGAGTVGGIRSRVDEREIGRQRIAQYEVDLAEAATSDLHDISSFERRRSEAESVIEQQRERIIRRAEYEYASGNNEALIDARRELQQLDRAMQEFELLSRVKEYRVQGSQQREGVSSPDIDLGRTAGLDVNLDDDSASSEGLDIDLSDDPPANVQSLQETQEQQPDDIVAPDGNPFRRYRVAQRKQKDDQEIVRVPNGFVLRPQLQAAETTTAVADSPALDIDLGLKEINDLDVESPDLIDLRLENLNDPETPRVSWSERLQLTQDQDTEQNQKSNQAHLQRRIRAQKQIQKNRQIDVDNDDILMAVAKLGGIDTDIKNDLQGRLPKIKTPFGVTSLDRPGKGLTLDEIAERLLPYGYIPETDIGNGVDSRILLDLMERAAAGGDVRSNHMDADDYMNQMFEDQAEAEQAYNEQLADQFLELYPEFENSYLEKQDADSLPDEYYAAELEEATSRRLTELVDDLDRIGVKRDRIIATIEAMARAGDSTADIMHELFALLEIEREEAAKRRSNESSSTPEETLLESYTNDDIVQAEQAERERQQATAAEQRRADQQATADDFQLTGSNREADQAAAAGQQDLLGTSSANDARGASNTVFTADAAQAARELLKKKLGNLNSGLDPEVIQAGITLAGFHIEAGARSFADYTARMVEDLGEGVRPYLRGWYEGVRYYPEFDANGMSSAQEIERYLAVEDATAESATLPEGIPEEVANDDTSANNRYVDPVQQAIADNFGQIKNNLALKRVVAQATNKKPREVTLPELKQAQEQYEAVMAEQARDVVELSDDSRNTYNQLVRLHQSMPNLNVRSSDSMARQAYSTPAPLAFVASKLGGLTNNGKTWDNSSGHGMLLLRTDKASAVPNELDPERFARLQSMGFANATNQNALDAPKKPQYPHVIANPPFGKMDGDYTIDGARLTTIDHALVAQALESMTDNGTASFIIGAGRQTADESAADSRFYQWLYGNYRVVDHVEVDGSLYTKQGASWPVRIISIRGREASDKLGPKPELIQRIDNWDKLYDHYEGVMGAIADGGIERSESISQRRDKGAEAKLSRIRNSGEGSTQSTARGTNTGSAGRAANANGNQQQSSVGTAPESQSNGTRSDGSNRNVGNTQSGTTVQSDPRTTENASSRTNKFNDAGRSNQLASDQLQAEYKSASSLSSLGALVPSNMRDNLTDFYNRLRSEVGDIDQYVKDRLGYTNDAEFQKAFMGLQVDAIASAIYNHDVNGQGIIIADQTGIGKGRQAAGIIRYARRQGKVPIFVTVKPNLFTDMFDDLHDIGETDINPFIMNADTGITVQDKNGNKKIKNKSLTGAKQKAMFADIISSGKLPEGTNVLFATYSQITTPNIQRDVFEALADKAWFVLDEAHNMAGNQFSIKKGGLKVLTGAGFVKSMTDKAPTTYLSATYAKRPDNMSAFTKTALSDAIPEQNADSENSRFADMSDPFAEAIASGGAPLQSVIAAELTKKGQLIRRERSFDGISIEAEIDNDNATLHRAIADQLVIGLRGIYEADRAFHQKDVKELKSIAKKAGAAAKAAGNRASNSVDHTSFSAVIHNYINQMLLGLKADYAADKAIALHKQGIKPVIALENTMESFIKDNTEMMVAGDEFSLDYRDVLHRALDRTRRITTTVNGKSDTTDVPLSELSLEVQVKYATAAEAIDKLQLEGIPLSPIDYIKNKMEQAGIKVGEITGRTMGLDYSSGSTPTLYKRSKAEKDDRRGTVNDFNNGALDALVLNVAGSTGLSIHNSTKLPESEQKKRHMIVVQMPLDINVMMQMLGRINRTGQRTEPDMLPSYTILGASVPAEKRPMAVALNKLASLNANTSANTEGSTTFEALNFFNEYGDDVVNDYLNSNIELAVQLDLNNELSGEGSATPGIAKKATGRMAAYATLPDQEAFYKAVEEEYKELIEYKDKIDDNKLKSSNLDLQARILESRTIHEDKKAKQTTAIAGNATAHKVSARQTTKPPDAKTVKTLIDKSLKGKEPQEAMNKLLDEVISKDRATKQIQKYDDALQAFNEALPGRSVAAENVTEAFAAVGDNASDKLKRAYENLQQVKYSRETLKAQARNDIANLAANWPIGKPVNVSPSKDEDSYLGVITGYIIKPPSSKQNPLARSQVKVEIALASPTGRIKLPASKAYGSGKTDPLVTAADSNLTVEDIFDSEQSGDVYENRIIITGNLVAAIDSVGKGQITTFTSADGKKHTGLLLPRSYKGDFDAIGDDQFIITNTQAGLAMLKKEGDALTTKSGDVKVIRQSQGAYEVQLAKSKSALAAQVRTSPRVRNQTGDFYTSPSLPHYTASVRSNNIENVVNVIQRVGAEFVLPESKRAQYVEQGGNEKALPGSFDNDSFRRKQSAGGLTAAKAKNTVKAIQRRWNNGPTINVVDSINDVPYLRDQYKDDNSIMGVYRNTDQSVYIIAGAHKNQQDVERTLLHEVQHFATRQRYGKEAVSRLAEVGQAIQRAGGIQNYVRKHNVDYDYAWYDQEFANAGLNEDQRLAKHVDELLADMAANGTTGIKSAARRAIAAIRRWLRSMGFNLTASLPNDLLVQMLNETQKVLNNKADPAIRPIRSRATNMHRVWHGSPHRFDKFSTEAINTGEGNQAFGFGLYFADSKEVAQSYKAKLEKFPSIDEIRSIFPDDVSGDAVKALRTITYQIDRNDISQDKGGQRLRNYSVELRTKYSDNELQAFVDKAVDKVNQYKGGLYQVELAPQQNEYLLWDKPLDQQSEKVKSALMSAGFNLNEKGSELYGGIDSSIAGGVDMFDGVSYEQIASVVGHDADPAQGASEYLRSLGIRGIKYLDGSSRRKGEGNHNYVVFDDADVVIEDMFRRTPQQVIQQTRTQTDQVIKDSNVGIRRWLKRNFTKEGLTNDKAFQLKIKSDAMKGAGELEVAALVHDFEKTLTKAYGKKRYNQIAKSDLEYINEYLGADPQTRNSFNLNPEVKGMADIMRSYIDRQSADMIAGINELVQLQISNLSSTQLNAMQQYYATQGVSGRVPADIMNNLNLMQTIQGNIGQYLNRSYAAFNDPNWKDKALRDTQLISRAESFIAQENPDLTPDEVTGAVRAILQSAADSGSFMTMISKGTKLGSKDISITRRRKNVPDVIRELLGEYKDPKLNFASSVSKMQWYTANQRFLINLRQQGENEFLFTKPTGEYDTKVAGDNSDTMNPLNGMYSTTDFAQGLIDAVDAFEGSDFMRTLIGLNSMVKYGKTILSPTTQFRNFQSAALFTVMNGHFDWSKTGKAWKSTVSDLVTKDSAWRDYTTKLTRLGVLHDNPYASELRLAMQDFADMDTYAQGPKQGIKRFGRKMADIYAAGDNFWKVVGFENEKENLMNSGMSEADAETMAANRIRNGYPTYSMVPRAIKKIRRWPLIGTFVSFPYEAMRTSYNQIGFMKEDLASGRKSMATKRMVGMAIATAASYAVSKATMAYFGIDEEDKEAILAQMPPWSRNSQLAFTGVDENGSPQYLDLSYLDPYTYLKKPITALFNGNNVGIDKKVVDAMTEVLAPFISPDIAATALVEILMNKRVGGGNVYNEQDTPPRQAAAILHHVFDATRPGVFNNIERTILALEGDVSRSGVEYTLGQEALGFVGHRVTTLNTRQALIYRAYEFNDAIRDSTAILSRVAGQQNNLSESQIQSAYDSMIRARGKAFRKMNRLVDGAKQLGVPESDIKELLSTARVSKDNITALMNGDTPEWEMSNRFAQSAQRRAVLTATSNQRRREIDQVMEQRKRIIQRLQEANRQLVDAGRS